MIARHETAAAGKNDLWAELAAALPASVIEWRQDGRPIQRDGKFVARFVAYIDSGTVRERLDAVVPGEWDLTLELMPTIAASDSDDATCSFKARLQILGVIREDVGVGRDYKQAATDAFKRAAVRFGIGHELYRMDTIWVQVDGDGKYAKPVDDPSQVYLRKLNKAGSGEQRADPTTASAPSSSRQTAPSASRPTNSPAASTPQFDAPPDEPSCPKCGSRMWDNRISKRNPKSPDFKCRSRSCDGVIWPPRAGDSDRAPSGSKPGRESAPEPLDDADSLDELPF